MVTSSGAPNSSSAAAALRAGEGAAARSSTPSNPPSPAKLSSGASMLTTIRPTAGDARSADTTRSSIGTPATGSSALCETPAAAAIGSAPRRRRAARRAPAP